MRWHAAEHVLACDILERTVCDVLVSEHVRATGTCCTAEVKPGAAAPTLQAAFSATRDLLFVLLARELVVFDLELGQPACNKTLAQGKQPFR